MKDMEKIKRIDIKEFRAKGYLQEINRKFLHPLGMALEVDILEDGSEALKGIWDYREDEEGMLYSKDMTHESSFKKMLKELKKSLMIRESLEKKSLVFSFSQYVRNNL